MTKRRPDEPALSNPRSDRVKAVARLSGRSARERTGLFLAEGPQSVREAVAEARRRSGRGSSDQSGDGFDDSSAAQSSHRPGASSGPDQSGGWRLVREVYATPSAADRFGDILTDAAAAEIGVHPVSDEVFAAMLAGTGTLAPQGLLAVCVQHTSTLDDVLSGRPRLVAVLSQVRDPGNAGTVIRAADAAGADAVVLTDASVDVHNPKAVRATAGSLFHLPVVTGVALTEAVTRLRDAGMWVLAADGLGDLDLDDLADAADDARRAQPAGSDPDADPADAAETDAGYDGSLGHGRGRRAVQTEPAPSGLNGPVAWIFGNEAWGLPDADRDLADAVVRVPVHGRAESLNLATAATVCLYATARAQRRPERRAHRAWPDGKTSGDV